jgi:hypothetical protein
MAQKTPAPTVTEPVANPTPEPIVAEPAAAGLTALLQAIQESQEDQEAQDRLRILETEIANLETQIRVRREEMSSLRAQIAQGAKERAKAASLLAAAAKTLRFDPTSLGIPDVSTPALATTPKPKRTGGKYSNLRLEIVSADGEVHLYRDEAPGTVLAHHSANCGGSKTGGRLSVDELIALVGGQEKYAAGNWEVTLPNGKKIRGVMVQG